MDRRSEPVLVPSAKGWDSYSVRRPDVVRVADGYRMYYLGIGQAGSMVGMASSSDGIHWTRYNDPDTADPLYARAIRCSHLGEAARAVSNYATHACCLQQMAGCSSTGRVPQLAAGRQVRADQRPDPAGEQPRWRALDECSGGSGADSGGHRAGTCRRFTRPASL